MAQERQVTVNFGGFFLPALTLVLVACKLTGNFDHSWWWVFAPMWIPVALFLAFLALWGLFMLGAFTVIAIASAFSPKYRVNRAKALKNRKAAKALNDYSKSFTRRS